MNGTLPGPLNEILQGVMNPVNDKSLAKLQIMIQNASKLVNSMLGRVLSNEEITESEKSDLVKEIEKFYGKALLLVMSGNDMESNPLDAFNYL